MCLLGTLVMLIPAGAVSAQASGVVVPPQSEGSCAGQVPIVVGSDAAAQSDIYAAAMLAGVIGSDCIVLAGPRDESMPADQQARLAAADAGGFVVGGTAAVPDSKIAGRAMTRLSGPDRWATARRVGQHAAGAAPDDSATQGVPPKIDGVAVPPQSQADCAGETPIVVGSDVAAQSDVYAAAMLAGVIGSDCIVLAGPRDGAVPTDQLARLGEAEDGGFVVGGIAAVPTAKIADRSMTRLSGLDRWETARLVGRRAAGDTTAGTPTDQESTTGAGTGSAPDLSTIEGVFAHAAAQRAEIVADLTAKIKAGTYGIDSNNVLRGPGGFRIHLDDCPDGWSDTAGISDTEIRIGYSFPQSGFLAAYGGIGSGMENYFEWVNENDPIAGHEIVLISKDDAYSAARTIANVDGFIEAENVLSITTLGSPNTLATYDRINAACIPQPFVQSGHPAWGDPVVHPWTTGSQMAYNTEAILWGTWIEQNLSSKLPVRVAAVVMDNDFGLAYELAFAEWVEAHPEVVSSFTPVRHDPTAQSLATEMQAVAGANPEVYISMTAGVPCTAAMQAAASNGLAVSIEAQGGALFTSSVCSGIDQYLEPAGAAADGWLVLRGGAKDTTDEQHADEPFIAFLNQNLTAAGLDSSNALNGTGYLFGYPYVEALRIAAELPGGITRTNLMLAVRSLDIDHPLYFDGIRFRLDGNADAYPIETSGVSRFDADEQSWGTPLELVDISRQTPNCVWIGDVGLQGGAFGFAGCGTTTRERLTTIAAQGPAGESNTYWSWAHAYRGDRDGPQYRLKPGYWQITANSSCLDWDDVDEEWRQGSKLGHGWIDINGRSVEVDQSARIRVGHGDRVYVTTWSGGSRGATKCQLNWVAELD